MGLFKTDEEKRLLKEKRDKEYKEWEEKKSIALQHRIKVLEDQIIKDRVFKGKVGATHTGWTFRDGLRNADKTKFKSTEFRIFDDKLLIERNRNVVHFYEVKEILKERKTEALIIMDNGNAIPIKSNNAEKFEAFVNILKRLIEENKSNDDSIKSNYNSKKQEDKFDKLIKLGELYEKGLLSDEEFTSLKQELLSDNDEELATTSEDNVETLKNNCENCGAEISFDDVFCSECGTKIKFN